MAPERENPLQTPATARKDSPPAHPINRSFLILLSLTILVTLILRLYRLETLQQEFYGDIDILQKYVLRILAGLWPVQFELSAGPLYHYLIIPIVKIVGTDYAGLKFASVVVSLAVLATTYLFSRRLVNDWFALLVTFIAGCSSWLLIFSRLGNSQIILPGLTMLSLWLVWRVVQPGRWYDVALCAVVASTGLYVYPQSFVLPVVVFITLAGLRGLGWPAPKRWMLWYGLVTSLFVIPFVYLLINDHSAYSSISYISDKFTVQSQPWLALAKNLWNALLALHVKGDQSYRSNALELPHLDWISGISMLAGMVYWLVDKERRRWWPIWVVPLVLLQIPSILVLNEPQEVPSASRTLGVASIVYFLVASGVWWIIQNVKKFEAVWWKKVERLKLLLQKATRTTWATQNEIASHAEAQLHTTLAMTKEGGTISKHAGNIHLFWLTGLVVASLLAGIFYLNVKRYFVDYIHGLPNENVSVGHIIGEYIDLLPMDTQVYIVGENWQPAGPGWFLEQEISQPRPINRFKPEELSCEQLPTIPRPAVLIWNPDNILPTPALNDCPEQLVSQLYEYRSKLIFRAASLLP